MLNFLPSKNKKEIIKEYILRVILVLLMFVLVFVVLLSTLFAPSFFFVKYKNTTVGNQLNSIKSQQAMTSEDPIGFIKNTNKLLTIFTKTNQNTVGYTDIIKKIVSLKNDQIKILSINIVKDSATNFKKIIVAGTTNTRDGLTTFERNIKNDGFFDKVIFPVSDFIKNANSEFSATLMYNK